MAAILPLENVYSYEPVPKELNEEEAKYVLGAQGNVWTEYIGNPKLGYMIFPRMSALAKYYGAQKIVVIQQILKERLLTQFKRYDLWGVNYSKAFFDLKASVLPTNDNNGVLWKCREQK